MPGIDFNGMTTNDLLQVMPKHENADWECKSALIFNDLGRFKGEKLGKIVSAFANSGGGYLVLGKRDESDDFDPVPTHEKATTLEDHLAHLIRTSVTPSYHGFDIHRLPVSGGSGSILVIEFRESEIGVHQSKSDVAYFYRIAGGIEKAPHEVLESLRSRKTRAVLEVQEPIFDVSLPLVHSFMKMTDRIALRVTAKVRVRNVTSHVATMYALRIATDDANSEWSGGPDHSFLTEGWLYRGEKAPLFGSLDDVFEVVFDFPILKREELGIHHLQYAWDSLTFTVQALTQDFQSSTTTYRPAKLLAENTIGILWSAINKRKEEEARWKEATSVLRINLEKQLPRSVQFDRGDRK